MGRVTGTVGDEDTVKVLRNLVNGIVVWEDGNGSTPADQAAENVLLDTTVDKSNMERCTGRLNDEGSLGSNTLHKVDLARVNEALILISIILFTNRDPSQGRALLSEVSNNSTSVNTRDSRNTLSGTPLAETLDGSPVAVVDSNIGHNDTSALNVGGLEVLEQVELVAGCGGNTVVANQGLGEDENLSSVGGVGHGLGVSNKGSSEDGFTRNVGVGAESLALEDRTILLNCKLRLRRESCFWEHTRMVRVAGREAAGAVARTAEKGIALPLLPATAFSDRYRT